MPSRVTENLTEVFIAGTTTNNYTRSPKLGTGVFEILTASLHPSSLLTYAMPARIMHEYVIGNQNYWKTLKTGYIGAQQGLILQNVIIEGPTTIAGWMEDPTSFPANFYLSYRRVVG